MRPGGEHEEFSLPSKIRVSEHRSGDVILAAPRMLSGDIAGQIGTDGTRRNMNRMGRENSGQAGAPERDDGERIRRRATRSAPPRESTDGPDTRERGRPLRIPIVDGDFVSVRNQIGGKGVPIWPRPTTPTRRKALVMITPRQLAAGPAD
jgi:hypothetical protein